MTHPIFQKELDALEHEFDPQNNNGLSCEDYERVKSFLLASLRRASLAVVEESVGKIEKREFEQWSTKHLEFIRVSDSTKHGIATATLATARTIVGEEKK